MHAGALPSARTEDALCSPSSVESPEHTPPFFGPQDPKIRSVDRQFVLRSLHGITFSRSSLARKALCIRMLCEHARLIREFIAQLYWIARTLLIEISYPDQQTGNWPFSRPSF